MTEFALLIAATLAGCWAFYLTGRKIGWLRPLIVLRPKQPPLARAGSCTVQPA